MLSLGSCSNFYLFRPRRLEKLGVFGLQLFENIEKKSKIIANEVEFAKNNSWERKDFVKYIQEKGKEEEIDEIYKHHMYIFFFITSNSNQKIIFDQKS